MLEEVSIWNFEYCFTTIRCKNGILSLFETSLKLTHAFYLSKTNIYRTGLYKLITTKDFKVYAVSHTTRATKGL